VLVTGGLTQVPDRPTIAVVCDAIYPFSQGGRETRYQELMPRLAQRYDMHVYTMHWWDGPRSYISDGVTYHAISPLLPMYTGNRRSLRQAVGFGLSCLRLLRCDFSVLDADHIPYSQLYVLWAVTRLKRKPFIVTWHEVWSRTYWCQYLGWAGWIAWLTERMAMRLPDRIIAASPQTAERLLKLRRGRIHVTTVPNGIDVNLIRETAADPEPADIVVVGRLIEHKHVGMLLDVLATLRANGMLLTCRIIGHGPARASLADQAQRLGISDAVEFCDGVTDHHEVYSLIKAGRLFVSLSVREGFGLAILEAIACGVPVLTTVAPDNHAQHLVAKYSRGTVCEPTPEAVTAAIRRLLTTARTCSAGPPITDPWVADYDWSAMADRVAKVYSSGR
jgi:glycosyltransferase involved in cell wall biosynthesis